MRNLFVLCLSTSVFTACSPENMGIVEPDSSESEQSIADEGSDESAEEEPAAEEDEENPEPESIQPGSCQQLMECVSDYFPAIEESMEEDFGEFGKCWDDVGDLVDCQTECTQTLWDLPETDAAATSCAGACPIQSGTYDMFIGDSTSPSKWPLACNEPGVIEFSEGLTTTVTEEGDFLLEFTFWNTPIEIEGKWEDGSAVATWWTTTVEDKLDVVITPETE